MTDIGNTRQWVLEYEITSSPIASWIGWEWGQDLCARYFAWKVNRKYNRYLKSLRIKRELIEKYGNL